MKLPPTKNTDITTKVGKIPTPLPNGNNELMQNQKVYHQGLLQRRLPRKSPRRAPPPYHPSPPQREKKRNFLPFYHRMGSAYYAIQTVERRGAGSGYVLRGYPHPTPSPQRKGNPIHFWKVIRIPLLAFVIKI